MELQTLVSALQAFGIKGVIMATVILALVFLAKRAGLVATANHARIANLTVSAILYGLGSDPTADQQLNALLSSLLSALMFEGIQYLQSVLTKG